MFNNETSSEDGETLMSLLRYQIAGFTEAFEKRFGNQLRCSPTLGTENPEYKS